MTRPTILGLWDMGQYWQCRFCYRAWRKQEPLSEQNWLFLSNHVRQHQGMPPRTGFQESLDIEWHDVGRHDPQSG